MRTALLRVILQPVVVIPFRRFGTTHRYLSINTLKHEKKNIFPNVHWISSLTILTAFIMTVLLFLSLSLSLSKTSPSDINDKLKCKLTWFVTIACSSCRDISIRTSAFISCISVQHDYHKQQPGRALSGYELQTVTFHGPVIFFRNCPQGASSSSFTRFLDHTQRRITLDRTPLDAWSARRRDLYLTTQHSQQTDVHAPRGVRTHSLSRRAATDLRLTPCGHWDRRLWFIC